MLLRKFLDELQQCIHYRILHFTRNVYIAYCIRRFRSWKSLGPAKVYRVGWNSPRRIRWKLVSLKEIAEIADKSRHSAWFACQFYRY